MFYTIYKITNNINKKYYIGKHQTKKLDDGYMGSGKMLIAAMKKYGLENFTKEILHIFYTEEEMNQKEKELVVISKETYNLCEGGKGGFSYLNKNKLNGGIRFSDKEQKILSGRLGGIKRASLPNAYEISIKGLETKRNNGFDFRTWLGKKHTLETIEKMKVSSKGKHVGKNNSQYGTCWITNGQENKKIKKEDIDNFLSLGYYKGRI
jgi:hypothetical protein